MLESLGLAWGVGQALLPQNSSPFEPNASLAECANVAARPAEVMLRPRKPEPWQPISDSVRGQPLPRGERREGNPHIPASRPTLRRA
jgi:hypothetical protein